MRKVGTQIIAPPIDFLPNERSDGNVPALFQWLEQNAPHADAAVIATDTLLYGGLIASRTHQISTKELTSRVDKLLSLIDNYGLKTYAYSTIMRTPYGSSGRTEPPYYKKYGTQLYIWSAFLDLAETRKLDKNEMVDFIRWHWSMPPEHRRDWQSRRDKNLSINKKLINAVQQNKFHYFVLGNDDTSELSASHREDRILRQLASSLSSSKYGHFAGADQLGLVLTMRAHNDFYHKHPKIHLVYNQGKGAATVPSYEDTTIANTVAAHISALGGTTSDELNADLILVINTPINGQTPDAGDIENTSNATYNNPNQLASKIQKYLYLNKPVALADISFSNGSDNALMNSIIQKKLTWQLAAYAAWNTASNSIGYALVQGLLARDISSSDRQELLAVRYLDDWGYQANIRGIIRQNFISPYAVDEENLSIYTYYLQTLIQTSLEQFMQDKLTDLPNFHVKIPWWRLFEVGITLQPNLHYKP